MIMGFANQKEALSILPNFRLCWTILRMYLQPTYHIRSHTNRLERIYAMNPTAKTDILYFYSVSIHLFSCPSLSDSSRKHTCDNFPQFFRSGNATS